VVLEGVRCIVLVLQLVLPLIWQCAETKKGFDGGVQAVTGESI
jgi:hypothetical protein